MKKYSTNITEGFCFQWTKSKACMEFVSNALDQGDYDFTLTEDSLTCTNFNVRVDPKVFMLGLSDKRGDDSKRGQFGCGIPQALAALLSQGCVVVMYNDDKVWKPSFKYCEHWGCEVLIVEELLNLQPTGNFTVEISNLEELDIDEIRQRCLVFQDRDVLYETEYGNIICNQSGEGEVFCGDIFVCQNEGFKLSYNFLPKQVPLTQDRNAVDNWELKKLTAKMILATEDVDFIKECIKAKNEDTYLVNSFSGDYTNEETNDSLAEEFIKEHGVVLVTNDYGEHLLNQDLGNKSVYICNDAMVESIKSSSLYKDAIEKVTMVQREPLKDLLKKYLDESFDLMYDNRLIDTSQQGTDEPRVGHNHLVDLHEQILQRIEDEL